jgi:hypothetical protein
MSFSVSAFVQSEAGSRVQGKLWNETREMLAKHLPKIEISVAFDKLKV